MRQLTLDKQNVLVPYRKLVMPAAEANEMGCGDLKSPYTAPSVTPVTPERCQSSSTAAFDSMADQSRLQLAEKESEAPGCRVAPTREGPTAFLHSRLPAHTRTSCIMSERHRAKVVPS